jgi:hypothetical protein
VTERRKELIKNWLFWFEKSVEQTVNNMMEDLEENYEDDEPERIMNYINERVEQELGTLENGIKGTIKEG